MPISRSRLKLIAIGFNAHGTGLTRVMHSILRRLADRHEIHYLGVGYAGETIRDRGLICHPTNQRGGGDAFAAYQAKQLIEEIDPDVVFILHDIWYFAHYLRVLGPYRNRTKIVCYIPLDGKIVKDEDAEALESADRVVVYTEFAHREFEAAFERLRAKRGGDYPLVEVIPHGVDCERFHPFPALKQAAFAAPARAEAKRKVFAGLGDLEDSFIVLSASRPERRKRIDLTIEGFARFAAGKPANVRLCLHHAIITDTERPQVHALIERFKLHQRVLLNPLGNGVADDAALNLLYNACDVGLLTSIGEGWGLVSFEHGAAGAAQIVPDHSACAEIWRERAELIAPARRYKPWFSTLEMAEVSAESVAHALDNLYRDAQRCQQLAQAAFTASQNPAYSWDAIAARFDGLFAELAR